MSQKQLEILKQGTEVWNAWRRENHNLNIDLSFSYVSNLDLKGVNLSKANLKGVYFEDCNLHRARFLSCNASSINFQNCNLEGATFALADLYFSYFAKTNLNAVSFNSANLYNASLADADLNTCTFKRASLIETFLRDSTLPDKDLNWAIGNSKEVKTWLALPHHINWTKTHIFIGCVSKTIEEWADLTPEDAYELDGPKARDFWVEHKGNILTMISNFPAV